MKDTLHDLLTLEIKPEEKEAFNLGFFDQYQFDCFITSLDMRSDAEVCSFLKQNLDFIVNKIIQNQWEYPTVLISEKFLFNLGRVLTTINITQNVRVAVNKICYDYHTANPNEDHPTIINLAKIVNREMIDRMIGKCDGMSENLAANLALCRYSNMNEKINIRRLNFVMCTKDIEILTVQNIVYIYEILFDRVGDLFKETMWEYYSPEQEIDNGSDFGEIYSTISLALLTIVNNMTLQNIETLIRGYVSDWEYVGRPPVRFSLISISGDYARVQMIVEKLREEKIYVP